MSARSGSTGKIPHFVPLQSICQKSNILCGSSVCGSFENVTSVLFVAAISAYDQVLYEDENTNRMVEALNLFGDICNSRWFRETSMILFLNKIDLFREKIKRVPLSVCFQEYEGKNEEAPAKAYIESQFHLQNRGDKHVYSHVTNATDTDHIAFVFNAVKDIIIRKSLNEAGLV